jgi:diaminopimelate decarboxylase
VVIDAGINLLYTTAWYQPTIYPGVAPTGGVQPTTVFGCLCMNIDVIREETALPDLRVGDPVVIHPVGAYNITQSMQFITYRPAVVMIDLGGTPRLIRRRETLADVTGPEVVPDHLAVTGGSAAPEPLDGGISEKPRMDANGRESGIEIRPIVQSDVPA